MDVFELTATLTLDSSEYDSGLDSAGNKAKGLASKLGGGLATAAKFGAAGLMAAAGAGVAMAGVFVKGTKAVAAYGDNIDKMSQKMGMSSTAYQEWAAVMEHSGTSMETLKSSMKTLATAAETGKDAFDRLGISQQQIASMSQEELFSATITALQNVTDETERTYLAGQLLGRGATELGPLLNTTAEETQAMKDRLHELGGVMSEESVKAAARFSDSLQDMHAAIDGAKRSLAEGFLPAMADVMDGISDVVSGVDVEGGLQKIEQGVDAFITNLNEIIPRIAELAARIIPAFGEAIVTNIPRLAQTGLDIITSLGQGIAEHIPDLLAKLPSIIVGITQFITNNLPTIIQTGVQIIVAIIKGLAQALPDLIAAAPQILAAIGQGILDSLQILWDNGPEIVKAIGQGILNSLSALGDLGVQIVQAIAEGILSALGWLGDAIISVFNGGLDAGDQAAAEYRSLGEHAATETTQGYRDNSFSLSQAIADSLNSANEQGQQVATRASVTGEILSTSTASGVTSNSGQISTATSSAVSNAISAGRAASAGASAIGAAISSGIASGIMSAANSVASAAASVVTRAMAAAKAAAAIASPSKKFRDEVGLQMGLGIAEGLEDSEDKVVQAANRVAEKAYQRSAEWLRRETKFQKLTLEAQLSVWQDIQSQFIAESRQWIQAEEEIFDLKEKIAEESARAEEKAAKDAWDDARELIRRRTKFEKLSAIEQVSLWEDLLNRYESTSEEYLEIDEKIFDLREDIAEDYEKQVQKTWENIADAYEGYTKKLQDRSEDIASAYGLFDDVQDRSRLNGEELVKNLTRQVNVMTSFYDELEQLSERGAGAEMVEEIRQMGPKAVDQLDALLKMSDKQFAKYVELYGKKQELANNTALKELAGLKDEVGAEIKKQLASLDNLYETTSPALGKTFAQSLAQGIKDSMGSVVQAATKLAEEANNAFLKKLNLSTSVGSSLGGTSSTSFARSALGGTSSAVITTLGSISGTSGGTYNINLNVDGSTVARTTFDPLKNYAASMGQPIVAAT